MGTRTGNGNRNGNGNLYKNLHAYPSTQGSDETLGLMAILFTSTARDDSDSRWSGSRTKEHNNRLSWGWVKVRVGTYCIYTGFMPFSGFCLSLYLARSSRLKATGHFTIAYSLLTYFCSQAACKGLYNFQYSLAISYLAQYYLTMVIVALSITMSPARVVPGCVCEQDYCESQVVLY